MHSSNKTKERKEKILAAHSILLLLDSNNFAGNVKLSFKKNEGLMTYIIEEYGSFVNDGKPKSIALEVGRNNNYLPK